jgi:hypothetical protein
MSLPGFEWNDEKALVNLRKHGVSFIEASTVFDDPNCLIMDDENHSIGKVRFLILGYSKAYRPRSPAANDFSDSMKRLDTIGVQRDCYAAFCYAKFTSCFQTSYVSPEIATTNQEEERA